MNALLPILASNQSSGFFLKLLLLVLLIFLSGLLIMETWSLISAILPGPLQVDVRVATVTD